MHDRPVTRRQILAASRSFVAASAVASVLPGMAQAQKPVTVGFLYVGPKNDYGWNQSHAVAAQKIARMEGVKLIEQENVPETV